jgi:hypothetical protein
MHSPHSRPPLQPQGYIYRGVAVARLKYAGIPWLTLLFVCSTFSGDSPASREIEALSSSAKRVFGEQAQLKTIRLTISALERETVRTQSGQHYTADSVWMLASFAGDSGMGYAIIDNVKGKDQFITYSVLVGRELEVRDIEILAYREPYGGEVKNTSWLKQFHGKQPGDQLRPGREIKNITGATISARAVTLGVRKMLTLLNVLKDRLPRTLEETR